jgi:predicted RNA-binding Zn ribbon-like protein
MFQRADDPVALAVDLVNTWDELESPQELLRDLSALQRFLERHAYAAARPTRSDLVRVRSLRDALRAGFEAVREADAVASLNRILGGSRARPQLEQGDDNWRLTWTGPLADVLAAATAMSLLEAIRDDGWERFGICAGAPCCCVFVDRSKNRSRRFCSDLCADRVAQAALRQRRKSSR